MTVERYCVATRFIKVWVSFNMIKNCDYASLSCKLSRAVKFKSFILKVPFLQTAARDFIFVSAGLEINFDLTLRW